jgi:hypothetical protein
MFDQDDLAYLVHVEEAALAEFPKGDHGSRECHRILQDWFPRLRERTAGDAEQYREEVWDAIETLRDLQFALRSRELWRDLWVDRDPAKPVSHTLWMWPTEKWLETSQFPWSAPSPIRVDHLDKALSKYLKRPWLQHDSIDISAINALIFSELAEYLEGIRSGNLFGTPYWSYALSGGNVLAQFGLAMAGSIIGFLTAWIALPTIALVLLYHGYATGAIVVVGIWSMYLLYRLVSLPEQWRARSARREMAKSADENVRALLKAWQAARGHMISPTRLRQLVVAAEERGVVFQPVLHTIIDQAIQRNPSALARE